MATVRSLVRPSCKKNRRWPTPQSGAERNCCGPALPWVIPSERPVPMLWTAKSEYGWKVTLLSAGSNDEAAVVSVGVWQFAQPTFTNWFDPWVTVFWLTPGGSAGVAGFESCIASAKLKRSALLSDMSPVPVKSVLSSGVALKDMQP